MTLPLLSGRAIAVVRRNQAALTQTGLTLADPRRTLVLERFNRTAAAWETLAPQEVLVRFAGDGGAKGAGASELATSLAASPSALGGTFEAFEPFDIQPADRFTMAGMSGHVERVMPVRNGKRRAGFTLETDTRGMS